MANQPVWEYHWISGTFRDVEATLSAAGAEGWEAVAMTQHAEIVRVLLKRQPAPPQMGNYAKTLVERDRARE